MALTTVQQGMVGTQTSIPMTYGSIGSGNASIIKNRIINGAMVISQYNGTSSVTPTNATYPIDRWRAYLSQASKFTTQQTTTAPTGFNNSLLITSSSAYSITSTDIFSMQQFIEGYNIADLGWGTANAKTVTLSFWVRSSLTGTFGGVLQNDAQNRSYPFTYTINSANTWEYETITIPGDTTGTWLTTNGRGIALWFGLGVGSTNSGTAGSWAGAAYYSATGATSVVGTSGATFYITGVQLEVGSSATGFEYVNYQTSLANCQRYYEVGSTYCGAGGTGVYASAPFCVTKRATPTVVVTASLAYTGGATGTVSAGVLSSTMFVMYNPANVHLGATWAATIEL